MDGDSVCVRERVRESEREKDKGSPSITGINSWNSFF